ncbi:LamG domain-containing protein, partial [bacterium]|nr:LamG domain-containing protein [bacterium]
VGHSEQYEVDRFSGEKGQDPVAIWHFDESYGSTANDSSKYGNDLTLYSNPTWNTDSVGAKARLLRNLEFDGTDDSASRSADLDFNFSDESFSISGWFRHPSSATGTDTILARYGDTASGPGGYKVYMNSSGYICAAIDDDSTWTPDDETCSTSAQGSYADSKWHHFEMVKDGSTSLTIYVDAQRVNYDDTIEASGSLNSNSGIFIGADSNNSNYWTGFIDEIVIYPYARTEDQVKADVFGSQTSVLFGVDPKDWLTDGLVGYWKMDEYSAGSSQVDRSDSSGNGNTLTDNNTTASDAGKFGNSSDFVSANSEYLSITDNASLSSGDVDYMITAWVKTPDITDANFFINKVGYANSSEWEYFFRIHNDAGTRKFQFEWYTDNLGNNSNVHADTFGVPSNDTWYFVAAYHDAANDEIGISINGGPFDTAAASGGNDGDSSFQMARPWYDGGYWDGELDEVRIYKRVLSPVEVADLYSWAPGPVGYWKLDEATGTSTYDSSGNNNTGTLTNDPVWVQGRFGNGVFFDGATDDDDYIDAGGDSSVDNIFDGGGTIALWVNAQSGRVCRGQFATKNNNNGWRVFGDPDSTDIHVRFAVDFDTNDARWDTSNDSLPKGEWAHVAVTYDSDSDTNDPTVYINGISYTTSNGKLNEASTPSGTREDDDTSTLTFGSDLATTCVMDGALDEIRMYNYPRTQQQIVENMNAGHPAPGSPIGSAIGHWKFDEGYGVTANNSGISGSALNGTLTNMASPATSTSGWTDEGKMGKGLVFDGSND